MTGHGLRGNGRLRSYHARSFAGKSTEEKFRLDAEGSLHAARILLCEDDLDTALALRERLRPIGFSTDFAYSPADAMTRAQTTHYDAVLVDLDLPDGNGIGLVRALRALPGIYNTPIMVISDDNSEDKGGGLDISHLNVLECIHKPVNVDQVAQILDRVIARDADGRAQILHVGDDREAV